jgi:hypothetical protein
MVESAQERSRTKADHWVQLAFVAKEFRLKGIRGRLGNRRLPYRERGGDRLREDVAMVEVVSLAEHPYIVEIFSCDYWLFQAPP